VQAFLDLKIGFRQIDRVIAHVVDTLPHGAAHSIEAVMAQDAAARAAAKPISPDWQNELPANRAGVRRRLGSDRLPRAGTLSGGALVRVKVLRFSVGMGKVVWSRRFGPDQTEWAIPACRWAATSRCSMRAKGLSGCRKRICARIHAPERLEAHRHRGRRPAGQLPARHRAVCRPVHARHRRAEQQNQRARRRRPPPAGLRSGDVITPSMASRCAWSELRWQFIQSAIDKHDIRLAAERQGRPHRPPPCRRPRWRASTWRRRAGQAASASASGGRWCAGDAQPAERAGLREGDLLTAVDGKPVADGIAFIDAHPRLGRQDSASGAAARQAALILDARRRPNRQNQQRNCNSR
jgi:hypothetical protein